MSEYFAIATLDPVLLTYYLIIALLALIGTMIFAYYQIESSFESGFNCGKADFGNQLVQAESEGYRKGFNEGKNVGKHEGETRFKQGAQKVNAVGTKPAKTPVKKTAKPSNKRRAARAPNPRFPHPKKPTKGAKVK
jgi:hypothetical protein